MARVARQVEDDGIYHILNRGNGWQRVFLKVETAVNWLWSSHRGRYGLQKDMLIKQLTVSWGGDWAQYVDTPLTPSELAKVRKKKETSARDDS